MGAKKIRNVDPSGKRWLSYRRFGVQVFINFLFKRSTTQTTKIILKKYFCCIFANSGLYKLCYIHSHFLSQLGFILVLKTNNNPFENQSKTASIFGLCFSLIFCRFELHFWTLLGGLGSTFGSKSEPGIRYDAPSDATSFNFRLRGALGSIFGRLGIDLGPIFDQFGYFFDWFLIDFSSNQAFIQRATFPRPPMASAGCAKRKQFPTTHARRKQIQSRLMSFVDDRICVPGLLRSQRDGCYFL